MGSTDDLFDQLARKQAGNELQAGEEALSEKASNALATLFKELRVKGKEFDAYDLSAAEKQLGSEIQPSLAILAGFLKGIPLPLIEDPEVSSESLGELGVCLMAGPKLFGFNDSVDGITYMPPSFEKLPEDWAHRLDDAHRFRTFLVTMINKSQAWENSFASEVSGEQDAICVAFGDPWAGTPPKTMLDQFMRHAFGGAKIVFGMKKLETIQFEREMRKAFGKA
jgi:hypothetical protein